MIRIAATIAILLCASATVAQPSEPTSARPPAVVTLVVGGSFSAGLATGLALGARDGAANDARLAYARRDPDALDYNLAWHRWGWATKPLLVLDFAGTVAIGGLVDPSPLEAALLAASFGAGVGLGFHLGHNWQQGQPWDYFGSVDPSDQVVHSVGPRVVLGVAIAGTAGLLWLTYRAMR